jgi:PAS domain S-box-containing protein
MLTETVPALIMIYQDNKIKYMNRSSYKILEIQDEGWIGKNFWEIMHADSQEGIRTRGNERMNSSNPNLRYEFELKTLSGKEIWLDVSGGVIDYKGKKAGFVTAYDITDRKRAEIVIQNSRNFYLSLFDEFPTLIWKTNKECKVDYYNKTWLHFRGITLEKELSNGWGIAVHPEDLDRTDAIYEEATKERRPFRVEYRLKHHTGEYKWVLDIGRPFYEIDGAFGGYIGTCLDINDQKALEESLKISEQYYKNLFESAHDAIIIFRPEDEMILDVNEQACKIYGFSREEMLHMSLKDVSEDIDRGREMIKDTLDKNFVHGLNTIHRTKFGNKMFIESNGAVINFKNEKAILAINRDVTSKKQAENQILSSLKEKEILLKEVHHRVKNNLQVISSLLKLQSEYINDKNDREIFRESQNRVRTMALIHEKLYRSHDLARIDFGDYVQNLTSSLLLTYNVNKHKIKLKYNIEKIFFDVDTAIPCGLLINELVSNCIKHAFGKDDSGEIKIELYTDEDNCYSMIVKDNGKGFPETVDFRNTKTLGMQLVVTLADQLDAVVSMDNHVGTSFLIKFKEIKYKERASKVN